jgi:hypothetical protein
MKETEVKQYLDPVFKYYGQDVYSYALADRIREDNEHRKATHKRIFNLIAQKGFQEQVLLSDADIKIIGGKRGGGKVLDNEAWIMTPYGRKHNGELRVGDLICDPSTGGSERVLAIYEHPDHEFYEVSFDDGASVLCGLEHLWVAKRICTAVVNRKRYATILEDDYTIWTFAAIRQWLDEKKEGKHEKEALAIPLTQPIIYQKSGPMMADFGAPPYVMGVLAGLDCIWRKDLDKGRIYADMTDELADAVAICGVEVKIENGRRYIDDKRIIDSARHYRCGGEKARHIPNRYLYGPVADRMEFASGMMDACGIAARNGVMTLVTKRKIIATDFQQLIRSLGGSCRRTAVPVLDDNQKRKLAKRRRLHGKTTPMTKTMRLLADKVYHDTFIMPDPSDMFRIPSKRSIALKARKPEMERRITGYRYAGRRDGRCITVDSDKGLYMTNGFIVTHNTFIGLFEALQYSFNPDVTMYGFRKYLGDIERGIWKSSKQVFRHFASPANSTFEWTFYNGTGATMKMEHLEDSSKIGDRFRGVEMTYILIEELAEHTRDNMNVLFDLLASNRTTSGVKPKCVCTCNPVGKSNKLRTFLDWWIDPETDMVIPERSGHKRYFYRYGDDISEIAWGDTPEEVYANVYAHDKIRKLCEDTMMPYKDFITSVVFIEGEYKDNKILRIADPTYMTHIAARGGESTQNDIRGIWRDVDSGDSLLTIADMDAFFSNNEQIGDGVMRASADVALSGDFFVLFAFKGHHICDMEAWRGVPSDAIVAFIRKFLDKNGIREENFTYDANGLGLWLKDQLPMAVGFNNKSAPSDSRLWNNLKSEAAEKFCKAVKNGQMSISEEVLKRSFTDDRKRTFTVKDRLMEERKAIKRKDTDNGRFEIISKPQMKTEIGHSPDFIEAMFMIMPMFEKQEKKMVRDGFDDFF